MGSKAPPEGGAVSDQRGSAQNEAQVQRRHAVNRGGSVAVIVRRGVAEARRDKDVVAMLEAVMVAPLVLAPIAAAAPFIGKGRSDRTTAHDRGYRDGQQAGAGETAESAGEGLAGLHGALLSEGWGDLIY